jgi:hypothetical protein
MFIPDSGSGFFFPSRIPYPEVKKAGQIRYRKAVLLTCITATGAIIQCTQQSNSESTFQRVLNALQRTRLSCGRMIWLLLHPLPPQYVLSFSVFLYFARVELTDGRGRRATIQTPKSLVLNKSSSTLWRVWSIYKLAPPFALHSHTPETSVILVSTARIFSKSASVLSEARALYSAAATLKARM